MTCDCGNKVAYRLRITSRGTSCRECAGLVSVANPDVFFKGPYLDPNLIDTNKPEQRHGVWIESRGQKAEIMRRLKVREAGDKQHGCRLEEPRALRREQAIHDRFRR